MYDPAAEFVQEFYNPERGDLILNPLDERSPYWALDSELYEHGAADAIAAALLPEKEHEKRILYRRSAPGPRSTVAVSGPPSRSCLPGWADPAEIEKRLQGTPQAAYLDPGAGPQRGGVLASLSLIADSLALLPEKDEKRGWFATERWKFLRTRWVFLTLPAFGTGTCSAAPLSLARPANPSHDGAVREPGEAGLVRPGRARQPQQTSPAPYRRDRKP